MKTFNTTAVCIPSKHYMVDLADRVREIRKLVDAGKYFTITRARQYGKTTTLQALDKALTDDYVVLNLSFEGLTYANFEKEQAFVRAFCRLLKEDPLLYQAIPETVRRQLEDYIGQKEEQATMSELFITLGEWCAISDKPVVLMIDEVDSATNNQVFRDFLALLRDKYIKRESRGFPAFQSVILVGVTDIRHLKRKIRENADDSDPDTMVNENSPWNIAADFTVDMSLPEDGIKVMLDEYEADHHTGMDTPAIAKQIWEYTNGYPFLVSRICELIDLTVSKTMPPSEAWTAKGMDEAVKLLLAEDNTLFAALTKNLNNYPALKASIKSLLMEGTRLVYNPDQNDIVQMKMYGFIRNDQNVVKIDNRIFETRLYNLFLSDEELKSNVFSQAGEFAKNIFIEDGRLNVRLILERFIDTYHEICGQLEDSYKEKDGREQFLLYLRPIINGTGNYYIEAQTRDHKRTDVIVDYLGQQYIIELKIWHGERYHAKGEEQIADYLNYWKLDTGYMLSFNFNKEKKSGVERVRVGDKILFEGTV